MSAADSSQTVDLPARPDPGEIAAFTAGERLMAVVNVDGSYFAFDDSCTHEACSFSQEGELHGNVLICGCHGGEFDVRTGAPLAGPVFEPLAVFRASPLGVGLRVEFAQRPDRPAGH